MSNNNNPTNSLLELCAPISPDTTSPFETLLLKIKEPIANNFDLCYPLIHCVDYHFIEKENAEGTRQHHPSDYLPFDPTPDEQYISYQIFLLRQENIRHMGTRYLKQEDAILELGAGLLDKNGDSNLSSAFPKEIAKGFSFCEINPVIVEQSLENSPSSSIKQADILKLKREYPAESFDRVVAMNVLDTLTQEDLSRALKEIHQVLKPYGTLIHYMNLEPFIYGLTHALMKEEEILIPIFDKEEERHFLRLSKATYHNVVRDKLIGKVTPLELAFLDYVVTLNRLEQERLCNTIIFNDDTFEYGRLGRLITQWARRINPMDFYVDYMKAALEEAGFRIEEGHYHVSEKQVRARVEGPYDQQIVTYGPMGKIVVPDENLAWGHSQFKIFTHAIIATAMR